jgi:tetratricopeptide (TPR) repeat protein
MRHGADARPLGPPDIFVGSQHRAASLPQDWWSSAFASAIRSIGRTLLVLCPWDNPAPFTRSWCLWEIFATLDAGISLEVQVVPRQEMAFMMAMVEDHDKIELAWCKIDARLASAFNPADKAMIDSAVLASAGGFAAVNGRIHHELRKWLGAQSDVALSFMRRLLSTRAKTLGKMHEDTMWALKKVAGMLRDMERYDEAEARFRELLRVRRELYGAAPHADVYAAMHDVAISIAHNDVLSDPGKLAEAEELFREAHAGRSRLLGVCVALADTEIGLAYLLNRTGRVGDAEEMLHAAVAHCRATQHSELYAVMGNLASKLMYRGAAEEAAAMYSEALAALIAATGEEHSMVLNIKMNLASALMLQGKRNEAATLLRGVVPAARVKLGPRHARTLAAEEQLSICESGAEFTVAGPGGHGAARSPDSSAAVSDHSADAALQSAFDRAAYMYAHNQMAEAVPLLTDLLQAAERAPTSVPGLMRVQAMNMLFACLYSLQRYAPAARMCDMALALHRTELGPAHAMTMAMVQNAASLHTKLGAYDKAEPLNRESLAGFVALHGDTHPHSMSAVKNLAFTLSKLRRWGEAEELFRRVLSLRSRALGERHPDTLTSKNDLAAFLAEASRARGAVAAASGAAAGGSGSAGAAGVVSAQALAAALAGMGLAPPPASAAVAAPAAPPAESESVQLLRDFAAAQRSELGDAHEHTLAAINNLAIHLCSTRPEEAEKLYREALAGRAAKLGEWHGDTTDVRYNLAMLLFRRRVKSGEAARLLFGLQRHYARRLGETHADTVETRAALACLLAAQLARCLQAQQRR